ncbi:MAG TPA: hypothetical protein VD761_11540 [Solirubrobacterales bacterium]|nr:hypothetical protein [Solirubrobacterales bacterium]
MPALFALSPTVSPAPSTVLRTASTFEFLLEEPLLEAGFRDCDLLLADLAFVLAFGFEAVFVFGFDDEFALLGAAPFRDLGFAFVFVWAIVSLLAAVPGLVVP